MARLGTSFSQSKTQNTSTNVAVRLSVAPCLLNVLKVDMFGPGRAVFGISSVVRMEDSVQQRTRITRTSVSLE